MIQLYFYLKTVNFQLTFSNKRILLRENIQKYAYGNIFVIKFCQNTPVRIMKTPLSQHGRKGNLQDAMKVFRQHNPISPQQSFNHNQKYSHALFPKSNRIHSISTPWIESKAKIEERIPKLESQFEGDNRIKLLGQKGKPKRQPRNTEPGGIIMRLNEVSELKVDEALYVVSILLDGFAEILAETGRVSIKLSACGITSEGKVIVRTDSRFSVTSSKNHMVFNEIECVLEIIRAVKEISDYKFNDFFSYYLMSASRNKCGFKYAKKLIKSYISCMKKKLPTSISMKFFKYSCSLSKSKIKNKVNQYQSKKKKRILIQPQFSSNNETRFYLKSTSRNKHCNEKIRTQHQPSRNKKEENRKSISIDAKHSPIRRAFLSNEKQKKNSSFIPQKNSLNRTPKSSNNIRNQFSFVLNPRQTIGEYPGNIKESQISTTQKTYSNKGSMKLKDSSDHGDWIFGGSHVTYKDPIKPVNLSTRLSSNELGSSLGKVVEEDSMKFFHGISQLPQKLEEVESFESSSEKECPESFKKQVSQRSSERQKNEKRNQIILKNCWTKKIEDLFSSATPVLNSSRVEGAEPEPIFQTSITQKLDKWARIIGESIIPEH